MARRPCCDEEHCPRVAVAEILDPADPLPDRVRTVACAVAGQCYGLEKEELTYCFERVFQVPSECSLCDEFVSAYETELAILEGRQAIAKAAE